MKKAPVRALEVDKDLKVAWKTPIWWRMKTWARLSNRKNARSVRRMRWSLSAVFWLHVDIVMLIKMCSLQFTIMDLFTMVDLLLTRTLHPLIAASLLLALFVNSLISSFQRLWDAVCAWTVTTVVKWAHVLPVQSLTSMILKAIKITTANLKRKFPSSICLKAKVVCFPWTWSTITSKQQTRFCSHQYKTRTTGTVPTSSATTSTSSKAKVTTSSSPSTPSA